MRTSTFLLAGPVAVSAQVLSTITGRVQTATISSGSEVLYTTTWTYSNPATNYLTLTDSDGVCTVHERVSDLGGGCFDGRPCSQAHRTRAMARTLLTHCYRS